jgi:hypothetical protein
MTDTHATAFYRSKAKVFPSDYWYGAQYDIAIEGARQTIDALESLVGDMRDRGVKGDVTRDKLDDLDARIDMVDDMIDGLKIVCEFEFEKLDG